VFLWIDGPGRKPCDAPRINYSKEEHERCFLRCSIFWIGEKRRKED
jgi:hypothetical protein